MEKICSKCKVSKLIKDFGVDRKTKSGYKFWCKECSVAFNREWRASNRTLARELDKKYRTKNKEKIKIKNKRRYQNLTLDQKFEMLVNTAKKRKQFECSISVEYVKSIWQKQEGRCAYTKLPLTADANQLTTMSLDRIDSDVGYVEGNVQLVCVSINRMKLDYPEHQFIQLCHCVAQNNSIKDYPTELALIP
jgi:hypothetical protein